MYKPILNTFAGLILSVAAEVPALINYQGRLVNGVGNPVTGSKEFKLDIYDSQTEGTLIYQETLPEITLDEDGAYSFQFGAGVSRSETSVVIATGDGEAAFFQKVFEETPVGVISVTDGTNTFKTGDVPTGDEPFSFTYTASLKRLNLVCNEPPAEGVKFTATFRYAESGIMGALGSAAEHWMEVTIGGDKQEPRQRLVAVPFALRAGSLAKPKAPREMLSQSMAIPYDMRELLSVGMFFSRETHGSRRASYFIDATVKKIDALGGEEIVYSSEKRAEGESLLALDGWNTFPLNLKLEEGYLHVLQIREGFAQAGRDIWYAYSSGNAVKLRYYSR